MDTFGIDTQVSIIKSIFFILYVYTNKGLIQMCNVLFLRQDRFGTRRQMFALAYKEPKKKVKDREQF